MAGSDPQPKKATPPRPAINAPRKPLQVMHISRKTEEEIINTESSEKEFPEQTKDKRFDEKVLAEKNISPLKAPDQKKVIQVNQSDNFHADTMEDLLRSEDNRDHKKKRIQSFNIFK